MLSCWLTSVLGVFSCFVYFCRAALIVLSWNRLKSVIMHFTCIMKLRHNRSRPSVAVVCKRRKIALQWRINKIWFLNWQQWLSASYGLVVVSVPARFLSPINWNRTKAPLHASYGKIQDSGQLVGAQLTNEEQMDGRNERPKASANKLLSTDYIYSTVISHWHEILMNCSGASK